MLDEVEESVIPADLAQTFQARPDSGAFFLALSKSVRKSILQWLVFAKRADTRQKRVAEIVERAARKLKPRYPG